MALKLRIAVAKGGKNFAIKNEFKNLFVCKI